MLIALLSTWQVHDVEAKYLEWSLDQYGLQGWPMLPSNPSHNCTFRAPLAKCHDVFVHSRPPPVLHQSVVEPVSREVTTIDTTMTIAQQLLSQMRWHSYSLSITMTSINVV